MTAAPPERLLAIVPALNESASVGGLVAEARRVLRADVLVVDDGSVDATAEVAWKAGAAVMSLPYNLGVGGAIRAGIRYAVQHRYGRAVQLDGDGQHDPAEAWRLLETLERENADLVIGSRFEAGYEVGAVRRIAMRLLARILSRRLGTTVTDATSGFRAMGRRALATFAQDYPEDYLSDTVEALLLARDAGLAIREVPVRMHARRAGRPSAGRVRTVYHLVRILLVIALHAVRERGRSEARP